MAVIARWEYENKTKKYIADLKLLLANIETLPVKSENSGLDLIVNSSTYVILGLLCNQMS